MTNDEWIGSLRKRAHDMASFIQEQESRLVRFDERQAQIVRRVEQIEEMVPVVEELKHQARVLKWALAALTAVAVGVMVKVL